MLSASIMADGAVEAQKLHKSLFVYENEAKKIVKKKHKNKTAGTQLIEGNKIRKKERREKSGIKTRGRI
jgi:hypothetical protein